MKRLFLLLPVCAVLCFASCEEKPRCLKITYEMYGVKCVTYQFMTYAEAQATFNEYDNVKIEETPDSQSDCYINNVKK